jgi:colanic acid/amylovoran biosynthesis glycosyltransferase
LVKSGAFPRLGYLISQYPAINHTFVLREIRALRAHFDVRTVSVRRSDRALEQLSAEEADEHRRTFSILDAGVAHALAANLRAFARQPVRYLRGLLFAWKLSRGTPRLLISNTFYLLEAAVAGEYFRSQGVTFVHTHFSSTVLLLLSRVYALRYSLTIHGSGEFDDVVGFHMAEKVAGATFVATISNYGCSQVLRASDPAHWHKVKVLPLGIDPQAFAPRTRPAPVAGEPFRLLFVGRLSAAKGPHILVEAIDLLRALGRQVEVTIVGDGPIRPALQAFIAERGLEREIRLVGACNHDRVALYYAQSDAFVLTSFAEGVPVVLMEAMASGLPCVSTWITGVPELIDNEIEGLLVPPAAPQQVAAAIVRLMDDPLLAKRLGEQGRAKVIAAYDLTRNSQRLAEVFQVYLAGTEPRPDYLGSQPQLAAPGDSAERWHERPP